MDKLEISAQNQHVEYVVEKNSTENFLKKQKVLLENKRKKKKATKKVDLLFLIKDCFSSSEEGISRLL
jgi:hypothetical protein|tara:strand:+ start:103 stop:306 length:204 start_codon:yes stop_codon:yes gene_type:complete